MSSEHADAQQRCALVGSARPSDLDTGRRVPTFRSELALTFATPFLANFRSTHGLCNVGLERPAQPLGQRIQAQAQGMRGLGPTPARQLQLGSMNNPGPIVRHLPQQGSENEMFNTISF